MWRNEASYSKFGPFKKAEFSKSNFFLIQTDVIAKLSLVICLLRLHKLWILWLSAEL